MDTKLLAETESLRRTAERLQRAGLVVDRQTLSPAHRRAMFALQVQLASEPEVHEPKRPLIGFAYRNAR
jgi:hypothetical protein